METSQVTFVASSTSVRGWCSVGVSRDFIRGHTRAHLSRSKLRQCRCRYQSLQTTTSLHMQVDGSPIWHLLISNDQGVNFTALQEAGVTPPQGARLIPLITPETKRSLLPLLENGMYLLIPAGEKPDSVSSIDCYCVKRIDQVLILAFQSVRDAKVYSDKLRVNTGISMDPYLIQEADVNLLASSNETGIAWVPDGTTIEPSRTMLA